MESSEDDAGAATDASRRASAREKDPGPSAEVDATASASREASGVHTPCESGAMSEDNFDGDSVPSPSTHDNNASTEAILDMIDEIVDGPGAPKRIPLSVESDVPVSILTLPTATPVEPIPDEPTEPAFIQPAPSPTAPTSPAPTSPAPSVLPAPSEPSPPEQDAVQSHPSSDNGVSQPEQQATTSDSLEEPPATLELFPTTSAKCESAPEDSLSDIPVVSISESSVPVEIAHSSNADRPQASSSVPEVCEDPVESIPDAPLVQNEEPQAAVDCPPPNIPSSSVEETIPSICEISECESNDRTVKQVTSSDNRDIVTVESAESTSGDASVSEGRAIAPESATRSPLRRRLIRPTAYDRRPDTTVSSTVDSRASDIEVTGQTNSESVAKDVSSSSDVVLPVHGNVNDEANSNVSEISVCKAETSTNPPPKKIKLIRQKITPSTSQSGISHDQVAIPESESPSTSTARLPEVPRECSSDCISTTETLDDVKAEPNQVTPSNVPVSEPIIEQISECVNEIPVVSKEIEQPSHSSTETVPQQNVAEPEDIVKKVPPIKLSLNVCNVPEPGVSDTNELNKNESSESGSCSVSGPDAAGSPKQIPKLTIKLGNKQPEEMKSPIPKLTIKPIRPPTAIEAKTDKFNSEPIPNITKINIKPIPRPPEKINDIHRKSSSSEISESECSENDDASASDQASTSDPGAAEVIPKVTIKLGRPGTESEGKFYTEQNAPKLTITGLQHNEQEESDSVSKLKVVVSQSEDKQSDKVPKLTIKTIAKPESQLSPKLTIKPLKPENASKEAEVDQNDIVFPESSGEVKETMHVPKITIKPVIKTDPEPSSKTPKKASVMCDSPEHIPVVTKLNIKPILKPTEDGETSEEQDETVPVVSKLNIKPILRPKDSEIDPSIEDIPKVTKLNIKPIKNPEEKSSEQKDCDEWNADSDEHSIPVVTKLNIKPIIKPVEDENVKDSENQSSETGNSSDDNTDIPVVTKLNIKPIVKPTESEDTVKANTSTEQSIPIVTKLNIKPLVKPDDTLSPSSPKKEIPVVTKLIIKPVMKPEEIAEVKISEDVDNATKNPPLVMKINMKAVADTSCSENIKINNIDETNEHVCNNINDNIPVVTKINIKPIVKPTDKTIELENEKNDLSNCHSHGVKEIDLIQPTDNCVSEPDSIVEKVEILNRKDIEIKSVSSGNHKIIKDNCLSVESSSMNSHHSNDLEQKLIERDSVEQSPVAITRNEQLNTNTEPDTKPVSTLPIVKQTSLSNCTLLKKLLENKKKDVDTRVKEPEEYESNLPCHEKSNPSPKSSPSFPNSDEIDKTKSKLSNDIIKSSLSSPDLMKQTSPSASYNIQAQNFRAENENLTKPLEINVSDKIATQSSGQDSPRIILKINKTDHGPSSKIITEEVKKAEHDHGSYSPENTQEIVNDKQKKGILNSRRKETSVSSTVALGKRLRSSRIVQETDKSPPIKRNASKRPPSADISPPPNKEPELSVLETKRLKLGQLLSNKGLTVTPVAKLQHTPIPTKVVESKQPAKTVNHTLLNNENCSKNGNSKLHNILSNLHANKIQGIQLNDINCVEKPQSMIPELDSSTSTGSSDVVEITPIENTHPQVQEMIINENSESHDFNMVGDDLSQDPLEVDHLKTEVSSDSISVPLTPQPKKRGRPRKIPLSEGAKSITLPTPALEERPQRSLRLTRDRPTILVKPRGRGRGRGVKRATSTPPKEVEPVVETATKFFIKEEKTPEEIDPTSSRVKLPRMTEALDKMPSVCTTPLSSRKRDSCTSTDEKMYPETQELKVVLECTKLEDTFMKSPETPGGEARGRGRGGRGSRGGRGRGTGKTPRGRGRGRGGGRGAMYMKETMGIYGRVCGPATTTVHLFEEETCMMDDNATPAKPSHLLDEDSQSSAKSLTNESSKMKKSKFADLFDSNKVWTAADVKEYMWPPPENPSVEHQVMMIQEQVAMFLGVKSFKRRYPELKRRSVGGEERSYILRKGLVTEALCDLGITAVDASEVLDIMLSDYPHKYEEYRSHQRAKQQAAAEEPPVKVERVDRVEMKIEKTVEPKPEPPKVDPEKTRQEAAAAAALAASEWNTRMNCMRRGACADLQSMTVLRRRAPPAPARAGAPAPLHVRPPAGFYPHALLPGQYQHAYRAYTPDQLRYFPLNTAVAAPPAPASASESSSESEPDWGSRSDSSDTDRLPAKRKKLTKVKRSSVVEPKEEPRDEELCRACHLREEGNRKYSHERFLVCSNCSGRLHPSCVELPADTIRKVREYAWQCAECKTCGACALPADDDKMLFCDLCDRGFHIYCVGLERVPSGRWHCVECAKCKSCGAREPSGLPPGPLPGGSAGGSGAPAGSPQGSVSAGGAEWHHQTRRGPGGHKLYSHSLCTPCARAYRIGRYCPLCDRSFIGPKGTMQLVICKLCDRQLHQDCVRATVSSLNVLDYTCGECRRSGITSRSAAARLAPRTIATLFMAKRRFNKYAHRQYLASRTRERAESNDLQPASDDDPEADARAPEPLDPLGPLEPGAD